jgi:hypothetical protein
MNGQLRFCLRVALAFGVLLPTMAHAGVDTAWVRRYDGPAHGEDWAVRIAVDTAGNVYVVGASMSDTGSNTQYLDFVTIKYFPNGDTAWVRRADFGGKDLPSGLGVDGQGNVYVTGTNNDSRMVTVKYDLAGHQKWVKLYGSQALSDGLVLDQDGNVIICGGDMQVSTDCIIIKYRPNGDTAWARFYDWAGYDDDLDVLAPTSQGGLCAVGYCSDTNPGGNVLVLKYDSTGNRQWAAYYDGPQHGADWPSAVAVDRVGNSYIAAVSDNGYGTSLDYLTIKYDSAGETLWTRRYDGPAHADDEANAVATDGSGNVLVTGYAKAIGSWQQCTTIKYGPAGEILWVAGFERNGEHSAGEAVAVDGTGCAYVAGGVAPAGQYSDYLTVKYSPAGETLWTRSYNGPSNSADYCRAIALGRDGSVCVTGGSQGDIVTIRYVQSGGVAERTEPGIPPLAIDARPNPLAARTSVRFGLPRGGSSSVRALDVSGRIVRTLQSGQSATGGHSVVWDGTDDQGKRVPAGVYILVLEAGGKMARAKVVLSE